MNFKSLRIWCNLKSYFIYLFFLVLPVYCYQPISLHPRAHMLSHVIPWTSACRTPLSVDFSRQEYWSGLPFPSPWSHILKGRMFVHSTSVIINIYTKVKEHERDSLVAQKVKVKVKESEVTVKESDSQRKLKESARNARDLDLIPGLGRPPGEGNGNPLQYSCQEDPMDRGAWQATVHGLTRVRHDLVTKPPPQPRASEWCSNLSVVSSQCQGLVRVL